MPGSGFASAADAAGMLDASLDHLAAVDWAPLGTEAHGEMLARLQRAQAKLTVVNAAVLSAFTAQCGYEPDGHKSARAWLTNRTGVSTAAAGHAVGWERRLARHQRIAARDGRRRHLRVLGQGDRRLDRTSSRRTSGTRPTRSCWTPPPAGCRWTTCGSWPARSTRPGRPSTRTRTTGTATPGMRTAPGPVPAPGRHAGRRRGGERRT